MAGVEGPLRAISFCSRASAIVSKFPVNIVPEATGDNGQFAAGQRFCLERDGRRKNGAGGE